MTMKEFYLLDLIFLFVSGFFGLALLLVCRLLGVLEILFLGWMLMFIACRFYTLSLLLTLTWALMRLNNTAVLTLDLYTSLFADAVRAFWTPWLWFWIIWIRLTDTIACLLGILVMLRLCGR